MKKLILICVLLSGCASLSGVQMTDAERAACESELLKEHSQDEIHV